MPSRMPRRVLRSSFFFLPFFGLVPSWNFFFLLPVYISARSKADAWLNEKMGFLNSMKKRAMENLAQNKQTLDERAEKIKNELTNANELANKNKKSEVKGIWVPSLSCLLVSLDSFFFHLLSLSLSLSSCRTWTL